MRTTVTLDDDVAAFVEDERRRTGETFREALNRLLRRAAGQRSGPPVRSVPLPLLGGRPRLDITDVSAVLGALDDERALERRLP